MLLKDLAFQAGLRLTFRVLLPYYDYFFSVFTIIIIIIVIIIVIFTAIITILCYIHRSLHVL